jgi:hypothetical protein
MKNLVNKKQTKKVKFAGDTVEIKKLGVAEVMSLQKEIKKSGEKDPMKIIRTTLRMSVTGAEELTDEEFDTFSLSDLNDLSTEILEYCGILKVAEAGN